MKIFTTAIAFLLVRIGTTNASPTCLSFNAACNNANDECCENLACRPSFYPPYSCRPCLETGSIYSCEDDGDCCGEEGFCLNDECCTPSPACSTRGLEKFAICHQENLGAGSGPPRFHTICVAPSAVSSHLAHKDDYCGECICDAYFGDACVPGAGDCCYGTCDIVTNTCECIQGGDQNILCASDDDCCPGSICTSMPPTTANPHPAPTCTVAP